VLIRQQAGWIAATLLLSGAAHAQDVDFVLSVPTTEFFLGEVIPLQLSFTSVQPGSYEADTRLYDRVGRMNYIEEFIAAPAALTEDPLQGLQGGIGAMGGLSGGPVALSPKPFTVERVLNDWIRFKQPGEYRMYVISRRVSLRPHEPGQPLELVSNTLTLQIRAASQAWVKQQIRSAREILRGASSAGPEAHPQMRQARRVLRFLPGPEAAEELVLALTAGNDVDSLSDYLAVLGSPYRVQLLPLMEQRLIAADQPVCDRYLDTLAQLGEFIESGGPPAPYPSEPRAQAVWQADQKHRALVRTRKANQYATRLVAALSGKRPAARAESLQTLLNVGLRSAGADPPWLRTLAPSLIADFRRLPVSTQGTLIEHFWSTLKGPGILPVLRDLISNPPLQSIALRRLYELSPQEGRKILLTEIGRPGGSSFPFSALAMLPDATLPELNDRLAEGFDPLLILRYATGGIVKRVERKFEARNAELRQYDVPSCVGPLAFYFLKFDPPFGERVLREQFARDSLPPACYDIGFQFHQLGRWAYSPALEHLAIESLMSPKVPVKRGAAEVLGKFGSAAAQEPLWEAMEYFRSWWQGRESELLEKSGHEGVQLELALRIALAVADGWTLQEPGLTRLLRLCSSESCRTDVRRWIAAAQSPVTISPVPQPSGEWAYTIAQYGPGDEEWLRKKMLQFPQNTAFQASPGSKEARARIAELVAAQTSGVIAYTRAPDGAPPWPVQNICTVRADGAADRCLTTDGHSHHPAWSPDGKRILFIHDSTLSTKPPYRETADTISHHPIELSVMDADGQNRQVLRVIEPAIHHVAWSPDGATLAISATAAVKPGESPRHGLFLLPASGQGELRLFRKDAWTPSWSPDGTRLAFTVEHPRGRWRVYTANVDGTAETALGGPDLNSGSPAWSPGGEQIAFSQFTDPSGRRQVFVTNANGAGIRQLTAGAAWSCDHPSWSPSGAQLLVSCRSAGSPCGMGLFSTGHKMPDCSRRLFLVPVASEAPAQPTMLFDHDGAVASFAPR